MKKKLIIGLIGLIVIGIGVGIFINLNNTKKEEPPKTVKPIPPKPKLKIINEESNSRPYAVMINNHAQARINHAGLQDAYIVYEIIVEGGLTRMMAIFKDKETAKIGSVRSSRHYFLDYALENDAIYIHYGWSPQAESDIRKLGVNNINGLYDSGFWRDKTLNVNYEHTAFTNIENMKQTISKKNYRTTSDKKLLLNYSIDNIDINTIEGALVANNVSLKYSNYVTSSYIYNPDTKLYYRSVNGTIHNDGITKAQYTTKNIIIEKVYNYSIDSYGRQTLDNIKETDGYYLTNGYSIPIKCTKTARGEQTKYTYLDGTEIKVNDGNTFIQIMPINSTPIFS